MTDSTVASAPTPIAEEALGALRLEMRGQVTVPGDPGYADVRGAFNAMHPDTPAVVATCMDTADVVAAVRFARGAGLPITVRGGGHSVAGLSTTDRGILIDLAPMRGVVMDPERKLAHVQGGALWADVDHEAQAYGLTTPGGVVSDTGVAGLALGGGYGWLRRKYGLSCDHLVEAQVVGPDGEVRTASAEQNPDLLWALRGGGGNFGIVTAFTFGLVPVGPTVAFAACFYPIEELPDVMRRWRAYVSRAPDEVTSVIVSITFPANPEMPEAVHDRPVAIVGGVYAGDAAEGLDEMQPLRELGTVLFDMSGPTPFTAVQTGFDPLFPRKTLRTYWKSQYVEELTDAAIDTIAALARDRPAPLTLLNTFHMGGAINAVDAEATAFAERSASFMVSIDGMWHEASDDERCIAWVRSAFDAITTHGTGGVYLNFTGIADESIDANVESAFGRNLRRLAQVKAKYDPENVFARNNNIAPSAS
jgi:FAD/FMN-containing dehydrogenase